MILETGTMRLVSIREVLRGKVNDVLVCAEDSSRTGVYYTVWVIKEHTAAKLIFEAFCSMGGNGEEEGPAYLECFSAGAFLCFSFPYIQERPLERFYRSEAYDKESRKRILLNMAAYCMTAGLPASVLYLLLEQGQLQLGQDGEVRFRYVLDLEEYDGECKERECVRACAKQIYNMLAQEGKAGLAGRKLIERKLQRDHYASMKELYRDVRLIMEKPARYGLLSGIRAIPDDKKRRLFKLLTAVSLLLAAAALIMLISSLLWGEIPIFRIFSNSFGRIGTESLMQ